MSAGLYIHVPFCESRCIYCEFYSVTEINLNNYISSLLIEAEYYSIKWKDFTFDTIYFGGGTPSLLLPDMLLEIIRKIKKMFHFLPDTEITIECNPDDINDNYSNEISDIVNRVSIGVQSFNDKTLKFLSRRHDSFSAVNSVKSFKESGINNISIDLIFGLPGMSDTEWEKQLAIASGLHVKHISAYMLTMHENTALHTLYGDNKVVLPDEDDCFRQYCSTIKVLAESGIKQYEISNFSVPGFESRHNKKYWEGKPWLGLGPSAHSYLPYKRFSNSSDINLFLNNTNKFFSSVSEEILKPEQIFNEYIMNRIRTVDGISVPELQTSFCQYIVKFNKTLEKLNKEWYVIENGYFKLTHSGMFVSDFITKEFFV